MNEIEKYFNAEKSESILFFTVGLIAFILSLYFLIKVKQPFYSGLSYAFITIALIQVTVGASVFFRSPKDITRVNEIIQTDKSKITTEEIPRMNTVMKNFVLYRWVEIGLILLGVILFFYFEPQTLVKGIGLGLIIQAGLMLLLDFFAESRGKNYLEYLQQLI